MPGDRKRLSEHGDISQSTLSGSGLITQGDEGSFAATLTGDPSAYGSISAARVEPGQRLGPYELVNHLGSGGMGEVYSARHLESGQQVAVKFLSRTTATLLYRFKREFRALADVEHRNLISLGELVVPPTGAAFFTMELVDGQPFVDYVRRRTEKHQLPNLVRLGRSFRQLVEGIAHLHEADCVHRDVKPSNVLVNREGRVVLLDFGLVSELAEPDEGISHDGQLLGTPAYMAPEQAGMGQVTPASDYYAVGVLLYECLTGVLPYRGSAMEILLHKQDTDTVPDPSELVPAVPELLRDLCVRLMDHDPSKRPGRDELLAAFSSPALGASEDSQAHAVARVRNRRKARGPFVGRKAELAVLDRALHDVQTKASAVTIHVHGESGYGKSALVNHFLAKVRGRDDTLVLRGRCLERESVPYKGVDSVVDALSAHLRRRPELDAASFRPRHLAPLAQIFPVLSDVWSLKGSAVQRFEPSEMRRLGLAALREVLTRLADERPLLIHIDDFQWADVDGARLLTSLVRPPDPPAIMLVVSYRDEIEERQALQELTSAEARLGREVREMQVGPLPDAEAKELALMLMEVGEGGSIKARQEAQDRAEAFARGAKGNPFYIGQMVLDQGAEVGETGDDRIVARRIVALEPEARRLLATVAVAGGPTPLSVIHTIYQANAEGSRTWAEQLGAVGEVIDELCEIGLLNRRGELESHESASGGTLDGPVLEAAHGRIREVMVSELDPGELREIHLELANALETLDGEPESLAEHFERAGEPGRAADYAEQAAEQAVDALAFGRAVQLYRRALTLLAESDHSDDPERRQRLRIALAEQLVNFGHSSEAGRLLRELSEQVQDPGQARVLERKAAEQLLHAGHVSEGLELSAAVLRKIGEPPPRGFWASMIKFAWGRLRLGLRGMKYKVRPEREVSAERLDHIDTLLTINKGMILHLEIHAWVLHNRLLQLTLDTGEPRRLGNMLANEMTIVASFGGQDKVNGLASQARELAASVGDLELDRVIDFQRDLVDYALNRFRDATDQLRDLLPRLDDVPGADWIRFSSVLVYSSLCVITGRWAELDRNLPQWLAAARDRGNLREIVELEAYAAMTEIHRGDLEQARYHFSNGREAWDNSRYTYTTSVLDRVEIFLLLAEGKHDEMLIRIESMLAAVSRSSVALNPVVKRFVDQLIGRCWTLAALHNPTDKRLQKQVRKVSKRLRRTKVSLYVGEATNNEAALHSLAGDVAEARRCWREAELLFEEHGIECHLAAVRWQLAKVTEGKESAKFAVLAGTYFELHGVSDPEHIAQLLAPMALPKQLGAGEQAALEA